MQKNGFIFMMWGILFVLLNLTIQHVNVLPSFVGFLLCAIGLRDIRRESVAFERMYILNYVLFGWSVLSLFIPAFRLSSTLSSGSGMQAAFHSDYSPFMSVSVVLTLVATALQIVWILWLCRGIKDMIAVYQQFQLTPAVSRSWSLYIISIAISMIAIALSTGAGAVFAPLVMIGFIIGSIVVVSFMNLLYRCAKEF